MSVYLTIEETGGGTAVTVVNGRHTNSGSSTAGATGAAMVAAVAVTKNNLGGIYVGPGRVGDSRVQRSR